MDRALNSRDLIATTRCLTEFGPQRPLQAGPRRAVSTAYYAMFYCLTSIAAVMLMGEAAAKLGAKCVAPRSTAA